MASNNSAAVASSIMSQAQKALQAATIYVSGRVKEEISVPAPRRLVQSNPPYYVATVKATPGAPPRKLSGQLRRSIAWEMRNGGNTGRVGTNIIYGRNLERQNHPYLSTAISKNKDAIVRILRRGFQSGGNV